MISPKNNEDYGEKKNIKHTPDVQEHPYPAFSTQPRTFSHPAKFTMPLLCHLAVDYWVSKELEKKIATEF